jgi:hypothetical protein
LDGSIPEFTGIGNSAWVPDGTLSPDHNVYRSIQCYPITESYGGFIEIGGDLYSLAPHKIHTYLLSDTHMWDAPNPRYLGPGVAQDKTEDCPDDPGKNGHLFIRLDNSTAEAQLNRRVPKIDDPDPRHHPIYIGSKTSFGMKITGSHLVIEDLAQINHFGSCFLMNTPGQTDVSIRNCGGRPIYFGARCGSIDDLSFDSCKFYAHMPSDTWWVSYADIKVTKDKEGNTSAGEPAANQVRKVGLDLGIATNVEVANCLFEEFFDGILAKGKNPNDPIDAPTAHDIQIHHTIFNHIWDDTWQMTGSLYNIDFHHNFCYGAGPSIDNPQANLHPGTVYIHHNVIDTTTRLVFRGRYGSPGMGMDESSPLPSHISSMAYTWPRKLYYNTIVTGRTCGGPDVGWGCPKGDTKQEIHEVYNNIFLVVDGRPGGRDFNASSGHEIYDGNVYWCYFTYLKHVLSPWRRLQMSSTDDPVSFPFSTVYELKKSKAFETSQNYYPPGWESSGLSEDPKLDRDYKPQNPSCQTGAVDLSAKGWPGTAIDHKEVWRGAINPF